MCAVIGSEKRVVIWCKSCCKLATRVGQGLGLGLRLRG